MNYEEAMALALNVPWKTTKCEADTCWCLMIEPKVKIECDEDEEIYIIGSGGIHKEAAEHIVAVHNESLRINHGC